MKIKNDVRCTLCKSANETIVHLLWNCCKTEQFLKYISHWLSTFNIQCNITEEHFIFGLQRGHSTDKILNFNMLYAKYYIYLAKCKNQQLFISIFQKKLQVMYRVHKQIAFSKNEEENFQADWSPYMRLISSIT